MPTNTAASMFGGAGGRGSRASVSSLEGLRNVLRNEPERDSAPAAPLNAAPPAASPADDKQTLRGLNDRLSGYLGKVRQLEQENAELEKEIDDILAKRKAPEGRDWDALAKPLSDLKDKIKDITMDNAKLLLQIDNAKLANNDLVNKLKDEVKGQKAVENDLVELKKNIADTKQNNLQTQREIDLLKEELARLVDEHRNEVEQLHDKVKNSEVTVEIDSRDSNLPEVVNRIRRQYEKLADQNQKETEEWYHCKFENIKLEEAQNTEVLESGKTHLQDLIRQKQQLEIQLQARHSTIRNLEEHLRSTKMDYSHRMTPLNQRILELQEQLKKVRAHLESQMEKNKDLLCVKMKLEAEINNYQELMMAHADSMELTLEDALQQDQKEPDPQQPLVENDELGTIESQEVAEDQSVPMTNCAPPAEPIQKKKTKTKSRKSSSSSSSTSSSSSSSSSDSEKEDEKKQEQGGGSEPTDNL